MRVVALYNNRKQYRNGKSTLIEYELRKLFLNSPEQFGVNDFYQNYPPLKISGKRCSLCRFKIYNMEENLNKDMEILDIGGNLSFFSLFLSKYVKNIDVVESNKKLTLIGKKLAEHEKIKNVNITNEDFKEYFVSKKYDMVMSLAIHRWVGLDFQEYLKKIHSFLRKDGLLLIESHVIYANSGDYILPSLKKSKLFTVIEEGIIDDFEGKHREFYWLKRK